MERIDTKSQRLKLVPRREPYWHKLSKGFFIGFRLTDKGSETWVARLRHCNKYSYSSIEFATDFETAKKSAEQWRDRMLGGITPKVPTVSEACLAYVHSLSVSRSRTSRDAQGRFGRLVYEKPIGKIRLDMLQATHIRQWMEDQLPRQEDAEELRRAKASANRNLASLKAALSLAFSDLRIGSNHSWSVVKPYGGVSIGRGDEAFVDQSLKKLYLEKSPPDLANLIRACLYTGARPGELEALEARDYNRSSKSLTFQKSKQQRPREIPLPEISAAFFDRLANGAIGGAKLLRCSDGTAWNKDKWKVAIRRVSRDFQLPLIRLYDLRHTAISEMLMAGVDTFVVATYTGTSVRMIEKTYGHLRQDGLRDSIARAISG